jgi:hypothetical protein
MKKLLLSLGLWLGLTSLVIAQAVNTVPQVGVTSAYQKQLTYSAVSLGLVPAASATDVFCISGSTSRSISIKRIGISGTAGTLVTVPITVLRRASLDTGGTAATTTALPVASPNISTDPASVATLVAYTANPTIVDASPLYFRSAVTSFNITSALVASPVLEWKFGEQIGDFSKALDIPKSTAGLMQQVCINLNAISISSGVLNIDMTWVEN